MLVSDWSEKDASEGDLSEQVLILVLVDVGLGRQVCAHCHGVQGVLILVLVDVGLGLRPASGSMTVSPS